VPQFIVINYLI